MRRIHLAWLLPITFLALPGSASAHCPLCTAGAGLAALAASYLGLSSASIGVFIGAFAVALGFWTSRLLKKRYIPYQTPIFVTLSFLLTIIPLLSLLSQYSSIYISWGGDYGSWTNRTYLIDVFLIGSMAGGLLLLVSPAISKQLTRLRNDVSFPYQGMAITFGLLVVAAVMAQLLTMV